jgi:hypothetical protein
MRLSKIANIKGVWQFAELNETEVEDALKELFDFNLKQMRDCLAMLGEDANNFPKNLLKILFDKQLVSSYTFISQKLDEKIRAMKDGRYTGKTSAPQFQTASKIAEKKLNEAIPGQPAKSGIDRAFENIEEFKDN